jgi:hypothetical protein
MQHERVVAARLGGHLLAYALELEEQMARRVRVADVIVACAWSDDCIAVEQQPPRRRRERGRIGRADARPIRGSVDVEHARANSEA